MRNTDAARAPAARPIHLQPLGHAYFTAPLLLRARAVSLFPVVCSWLMSLLLLLCWDLCALSRAAQLWGRRNEAAARTCCSSSSVCDGEEQSACFCGVGSGCGGAPREGTRIFRGVLQSVSSQPTSRELRGAVRCCRCRAQTCENSRPIRNVFHHC